MRELGAALAATVLLLASGCGGGDDRPSVDAISQALQDGTSAEELRLSAELPDEAADCIAQALVDSKISDEALTSIVEGDDDYTLTSKDEAALAPLTAELSECLKGLVPAG